jgi:hypothetical protein
MTSIQEIMVRHLTKKKEETFAWKVFAVFVIILIVAFTILSILFPSFWQNLGPSTPGGSYFIPWTSNGLP